MTKKGKVILIKPQNIVLKGFRFPPLGIMSIGTVLKNNGYDVKIIDANTDDNYRKVILRECINATLVGISILTAEVKDAIEICLMIKENYKVPIAIGGWHATLFPKQTCEDESVDFVICNEGEKTMLELVKELRKKKKSFRKIKGLAYKENGKVIINTRREVINLNELPEMDYDLIDTEKYISMNLVSEIRRSLPYESSRGCPYKCTFCINAVTKNHRWRKKDAEKVLDEIEKLVKKYNLNFISFIDDNFFIDIERAKKICLGIIERKININWFAECRANYFRKGMVDEDFLKLAKKSGLIILTIGAESGSEYTLKRIKKQIVVDDIINAAKVLNKFAISPNFSFMVGLPGESKKEMFKTIKLIGKLEKINKYMEGGVSSFVPYPKCELCEDLIKKGQFTEPKRFRDWANEENMKLYTETNYIRSWQEDPRLIRNIVYYCGMMLRHSPNQRKKYLSRIKYWPYLFFIKLTKIRLKLLFFGFPLDMHLQNLLQRIYTFIKSKQ